MMLARVAENLYWISRYVERAENVARLLDVGFHLELDAANLAGAGEPAPVEGVLSILACRDAFEATCGPAGLHNRQAVLRFLTFDLSHEHSILSMLARARENARATQETLSAEAWSQINTLYLTLGRRRSWRRFLDSPPRFYEGIKRSCILFAGLVDGTLPRTEPFQFLQLGRYLERVNQISRILQIKMQGLPSLNSGAGNGPPPRAVHWSSLLWSCSAHEAYLRTYHERIDPESVVRYLVLNEEFPRAIRYCIDRCCESIRALAGEDGDGFGTEAQRRLGRLDSELRYTDVSEIFDRGLDAFLVGIQDSSNRIGEEIHQAYFFT